MERRTYKILPINIAMLAIGLVDLFTTLFWLRTGRAVEINPIMAAVLKLGLVYFMLAKLLTLGAYVAVMEWYRRQRSAIVAQLVGSVTVLAYCSVYAVSFLCVNFKLPLGL